MQLFELHNAVSRTIGDPVENTGSLLIDGIRYSTRLRAQYIWQAMNDILIGAINRVATMPHTVQVEILERLFPSMLDGFTSSIPVAANNIAFVCSAYYETAGGGKIALPIVRSHRAMQTSFGRNTSVQPSDPFLLHRAGNIIQVVGINTENISTIVTINAIRRPPQHEWFSDNANASDNVGNVYEESWLPEVIRRSSLMSQLDSGELGTTAQAYPLIAVPQFAQLQG